MDELDRLPGEYGYDYTQSAEPSYYGTSAMTDLGGGAYGGAPAATDEWGNVQYGDLWYGGGTTYEDVYGGQAAPDVPEDYSDFEEWYATQDLTPYPTETGGSYGLPPIQTYDPMYGTTGMVGTLGGAIGGATNLPATNPASQPGSLYFPNNPLNPANNPQPNVDTTGTLAGEPWFQQGQLAAQQQVRQPRNDAAAAANVAAQIAGAAAGPGGEGGGANAGGRRKPADPHGNEGRIANGFIFKDGKWEKLPPKQQPRGGVQQMQPPRMAQGGQARPPQMPRIPGIMGGGGRAGGMPNLARPMPPGVGGVAGGPAGGGGPSSPKQNTAPLKQLLSEWKSSYQEAKKANEDRYAEILKGFRQNTTDILAQNDTQSESAKEDAQRAYDRFAADAVQSAKGRGLSNTTVADSLNRGVESDRQRAIRGIENDRITRMTQLMNQLKNQELGFMERREDTYPSMEMMAQLAQEIGRADPTGSYDFSDILGMTTGSTGSKVKKPNSQLVTKS